ALAHFRLAQYCWQQRKLDAAEASYKEAIRLNPDFPEALNNLGSVLLLQAVCQGVPGRIAEAIDSYQRSLALQPQDVGAHWNLARALLLAGDFERGWVEFEWRLHHRPLGIWRDFPQPM